VKKILLFFLALALAAYGQQTSVAVLPSDGTALGNDELEILTNKMREAALKVLPTNAFVLLKQDVVVKRLGGMENYIKECKESTCIVDLGKKAQVDYVAQANVRKLGNKLRITVELYSVRTGGLIGILNDEAEDINGLLAIINENVPALFEKIPEYMQIKEAERRKLAEEQARIEALEAERRKQAEKQARIEALEAEKREQVRLKELEAERLKQAKEQARIEALEAERRKQAEKLEKARIKELEAERHKQAKEQATIGYSWEWEKKLDRAKEQAMIGYEYLYKMPFGVRWSWGWFYNTLNFRWTDFKEWSLDGNSDDGPNFYLSNPNRIFKDWGNEYRHSGGYTDDAFEWIVGYIWRPFYWLGVFGGSGFRHTREYRRYDIYGGYSSNLSYKDTKWVSANELRHDFKYELGLEFVVYEKYAAYISVRNFIGYSGNGYIGIGGYTGGGIGFVF